MIAQGGDQSWNTGRQCLVQFISGSGKHYEIEKKGKLNEVWPLQGLGESVGLLQVPCPTR